MRPGAAVTGLALVLATTTLSASPPQPSGPILYTVEGRDARLNRRITGAVAAWLNGVAVRPVDAFVYDGEGSRPVEGSISITVDPAHDQGTVVARWSDENGDWEYRQAALLHPHHASGARLGASRASRDLLLNEGAITNVYLHGDTTAGLPVMPTLFTHLALWGPAVVTLNGLPFPNPYGIPGPMWEGHIMVSEGARGADGAIRTVSGAPFRPAAGAEGATDPLDLEVHLTWHDARFPRVPDNIPPLFDVFYHLLFEDVAIQVLQVDLPAPPAGAGPAPGAAATPPTFPDRSLLDRSALPFPAGAGGAPGSSLSYRVEAGHATVHRRLTGPVEHAVDGVPAQPVDAVDPEGAAGEPVEGHASLLAQPAIGRAVADVRWRDRHGTWRLQFETDAGMATPAGLRFAPSARALAAVAGPVAPNVYAGGDTGIGGAPLPARFAQLRLLGRALVTLDGMPFGGAQRRWSAEVVAGEGVRRPDGTVRTRDGGIYRGDRPGEGEVERYDLELRVAFFEEGTAPGNVPTDHAFHYAVTFEDIEILAAQGDGARAPGR